MQAVQAALKMYLNRSHCAIGIPLGKAQASGFSFVSAKEVWLKELWLQGPGLQQSRVEKEKDEFAVSC